MDSLTGVTGSNSHDGNKNSLPRYTYGETVQDDVLSFRVRIMVKKRAQKKSVPSGEESSSMVCPQCKHQLTPHVSAQLWTCDSGVHGRTGWHMRLPEDEAKKRRLK